MKIDLNLYVSATLSIALDSSDRRSEILIDYWHEYDVLILLGVINRWETTYAAWIQLTSFGRECQLHKDNWLAWILVPLE